MVRKEQPREMVFQFTHPRGVRRASSLAICTLRSTFQFTHPRGVRLLASVRIQSVDPVSIHAPARGATSLKVVPIIGTKFQFTHPRGVRQVYQASHLDYLISFNSRTREGCDERLD